MEIKIRDTSIRRVLSLAAVGTAAGFINGLLGAGGGILIVWILSRMRASDGAEGVRDTFASSLAAVIPITLISALRYTAEGHIHPSDLSPLLLPAIAGGALGAWLLSHVSGHALKRIFAALLVLSGIFMLTR